MRSTRELYKIADRTAKYYLICPTFRHVRSGKPALPDHYQYLPCLNYSYHIGQVNGPMWLARNGYPLLGFQDPETGLFKPAAIAERSANQHKKEKEMKFGSRVLVAVGALVPALTLAVFWGSNSIGGSNNDAVILLGRILGL